MGEVEKNSFIALPGKGGHSKLMPTKPVCPTQEDLVRRFMATVQGGTDDKIRVKWLGTWKMMESGFIMVQAST